MGAGGFRLSKKLDSVIPSEAKNLESFSAGMDSSAIPASE